MNYSISIRAYGVHAILIEWPNHVKEDILEDILSFKEYLIHTCIDAKDWEVIPAYNSLTLIFRKKEIVFNKVKEQLQQWYSQKTPYIKDSFLWKLPVCYDASFGIDLKETCDVLNLSMEELIKCHTEKEYTVYGIGFLPGFMYLGGLGKELEIARRASPRPKVEKGSVGLAGKQTGIYPQNSPGGWNIIGNCPVPMFNPKEEKPCFVSVGDKVQFYRIEKKVYDLIKIENEVGVFNIEKSKIHA
ncbi:5-oxoprolinase subunit PxpB [uncultured Maribacter sp.]|uniref:5-oxoprolinase subunit PxpB n=1 Tax=uncultured Maribacter sp. TaxID=431308 RepID=UPI0026133AEC|nr:5-oxoprolinase subunit PxpB [uncultured Maribacter sp.]